MFLALDSEYTISALETEDRVLAIWFANRVAKISDHMDEWKRAGIKVYEVHHCHRPKNMADLGAYNLGNLITVPGFRPESPNKPPHVLGLRR